MQRETKTNLFSGPYGETIAYIDTHVGKETLVWVHGLTDSLNSWQLNFSFFQNYYRCILIDLPGHGSSTNGNHNFSIEAYSESVHKLLNHLSIRTFHIVGHSMGGQIAIYLSLHLNNAVKSISLSAPAGLETFTKEEIKFLIDLTGGNKLGIPNNFQKILPSLNNNLFRVDQDIQREMLKKLKISSDKMLANPAHIIQKSMEGMLFTPVFDELDKIQCPVLIVMGLEDKLIPNRLIHFYSMTELMQIVVKKLPKATIHMYPDCGHMPHLEYSSKFNLDVYKFLNQEIYNK